MTSTAMEKAPCVIDSQVGTIRILHVDDDSLFLGISRQILMDANDLFEIDGAFFVDEALEKMRQNEYDVILSDYDMPSKNGLEFLKELREQNNRVPFILFTGKGREEIAAQALNLGANGYVDKHGDTETVYCELAHNIRAAFAHHKAELDVAESEAKYHELVDRLPEMVLEIDDKGKVAFANNRVLELTGYSAEDLSNDFDANRLVAPEDLDRSRRNMKEMFAGKIRQSNEYTFRKKDGTKFPVLLTSSLVMKDNMPAGARGIVVDLTESKNAEQTIARNQALFESIANSTRDWVWSVSADDFRLLAFNNAVNEYFVRTEGVQLRPGMNVGILLAKETEEKLRAFFKKALTEGTFTVEYTTTKDPRVFEFTFNVLKHQEKPFAIAVFGKDVTERKKAEVALLESENRFRELANSLPEIIFEIDAEANMTFANAQAFQLTGYSQEDVKRGFNALSILAREDVEKAKANITRVLSGNTVYAAEYTLVRRDGTRFPVSLSASPIVKQGKIIGVRGIAFNLANHSEP